MSNSGEYQANSGEHTINSGEHMINSGEHMQFDTAIPYAKLQGARVVVGLSGGVDSSVSAALLKEHGLEVTALFMKNWEEDDTDTYCSAAEDRDYASRVCDELGIEFKTINFAAEYWDNVFEYFLREYRAGRTPNPDVLCNREIKFKAFLNYALDDLHADFIATGHYCRRSFNPGTAARLIRGADPQKDQSYFLNALNSAVLEKVLFPVGELRKTEVRKMAAERHLATAQRKDSTGICFIGERRFRDFLSRFLPAQPGPILTLDGTVVGEHQGLMFATIGQRRGLGIGGVSGAGSAAWYVAGKDLKRNALIVVQGRHHPALYAPALEAAEVNWIAGEPQLPLECSCKIRYRQQDLPCRVFPLADGVLKVRFKKPAAAVSPGQYAVFYQGEECLGGAVILRAVKEDS